MGDYILVDHPDAWASVLPRLRFPGRLAVDLEGDFDLYRYGKHLCLIQLSDGTETWIVDPLRISDLSGLWEVFADPEIEKIFFGSQTDVRLLRHRGCMVSNLVDLHEAAKILGLEGQNLPFLTRHYLDEEFIKKEEIQVSNWNLRPLSPEQLAYAADDVRHLLAIWDRMRIEFQERRQWKTFQNRMKALEALEFKKNPTPWMKTKNIHLLSPHQTGLLKYLYLARDEAARRLDVPASRVVESENLIELCLHPPEPPERGVELPEFPALALAAQPLRAAFWFALRLGLELKDR